MKTIKLTRTTRREVPGGWFVQIGPQYLTFRKKRSKECFCISWSDVIAKAQLMAVLDAQKRIPPQPNAVVESDPRQMPMFGIGPFVTSREGVTVHDEGRRNPHAQHPDLPPNVAQNAFLDHLYGDMPDPPLGEPEDNPFDAEPAIEEEGNRAY